jgi:hypothetical protein
MNRVRDLRVRPDLLYVASGWSTLVTDVHGRITGSDPQGFFARNTRVLSRERITVDGREPVAFSTGNVGAHAQLSYAQLTDGEALPSRGVYLMVKRFLGDGLWTRLTVLSYADQPRTVQLGGALSVMRTREPSAGPRPTRRCGQRRRDRARRPARGAGQRVGPLPSSRS